MSYFCANAIKINKKDKTFKVKGGDNNIVPRCNSWTNEIPLDALLTELIGRTIQFTTRSEKHLTIEGIAKEFDSMLTQHYSFNAYSLQTILMNSRSEAIEIYSACVADAIKYKDNYTAPYGQNKIDEANLLLGLAQNNYSFNKIKNVNENFINAILELKIPKPTYVVYKNNRFAYKVSARKMQMTPLQSEAKLFGKYKAMEIAYNFDAKLKEEIK